MKPEYQAATAAGLALYLNSSGTFPYARPHQTLSTRGTLVSVTARQWAMTSLRLDALEGYDPRRPGQGHYVRRRWPVRTDGGRQLLAWVYLAGPRTQVDIERL